MLSAPLTQALQELDRARLVVRRVANRQVRSVDDRAALRATATAWFHTHRVQLIANADASLLAAIDNPYHAVLEGTEKNTSKTVYLEAMGRAKAALIALRAQVVTVNLVADAAPDFALLTRDAEMQRILERRWIECTKCVSAQAHLAAIVMMGGLLEALFVARAQQLPDKNTLFAAPSTPRENGKAVSLDRWMLNSYLTVGHDVGWITRSARDVAVVLGEFRNYVHPAKERRHGVALGEHDSAILWGVTKNLTAQLLTSVK